MLTALHSERLRARHGQRHGGSGRNCLELEIRLEVSVQAKQPDIPEVKNLCTRVLSAFIFHDSFQAALGYLSAKYFSIRIL